MATPHIKLTKQDIIATESYKSFNKMIQTFAIKRNNLLQIENGVNVASNIGLEQWEKQTNFSHHNAMIVKDILKKIGTVYSRVP